MHLPILSLLLPTLSTAVPYLANVDHRSNMPQAVAEAKAIDGVTVKKVFDMLPMFVFEAESDEGKNAVRQVEHVEFVEDYYGWLSQVWTTNGHPRHLSQRSRRRF
eukprot:TRINITY_DN69613_c0_g1_i1.p1 TRINITY_DN69613_c0_g1~~TRINITY_DN69613_c0_g1_i1.p1  ORF type:complete len:118 (-),score=15.86 TRINITY_DN69613_c0_g1_i1:150-464(-)